MSVRASLWAWQQTGLSPNTRLVLLALADHADHDGVCWPGRKHLAERVQIEERSVTRHLNALEEAKLIKREPIWGSNGQQVGVKYALTQGGDSSDTPGRQESHPGGDSSEQGGATAVSPKPSGEPPQEREKARATDLETERLVLSRLGEVADREQLRLNERAAIQACDAHPELDLVAEAQRLVEWTPDHAWPTDLAGFWARWLNRAAARAKAERPSHNGGPGWKQPPRRQSPDEAAAVAHAAVERRERRHQAQDARRTPA